MTEKPQENLSSEYIKDRLNEIGHLLSDFDIEIEKAKEAGEVKQVGEILGQIRALKKERTELLELKKNK